MNHKKNLNDVTKRGLGLGAWIRERWVVTAFTEIAFGPGFLCSRHFKKKLKEFFYKLSKDLKIIL
jgi:hypothetical protein